MTFSGIRLVHSADACSHTQKLMIHLIHFDGVSFGIQIYIEIEKKQHPNTEATYKSFSANFTVQLQISGHFRCSTRSKATNTNNGMVGAHHRRAYTDARCVAFEQFSMIRDIPTK